MRERTVSVAPDGEPDPMSTAIARRLRELPSELPPPFDWSELQRRANLKSSPVARRAVLLAAALASLVAGAALIIRLVGTEPRGQMPQITQSTAPAPAPADLRAAGAGHDSERLLQRAKAAERWLASTPDNRQVVQVSTYLAVSALEDRIASLDDQLSTERIRNGAPARVRALQLQRARLVDSLAQVRYAELLAAEVP